MIKAEFSAEHQGDRLSSLLDPNRFVGSVLIGIVSGFVAGLVTGLLARASMRAVALLGGMAPEFSLAGTLAVVGFGVAFGVMAGLVYAILLPYLPGSLSRKGLVFGAILALLLLVMIVLIPLEGELALASRAALVALFASIPLVYGYVLGKMTTWLIRKETNLAENSSLFAGMAAVITIICAAVNIIIESTFVLAHPINITLGFDVASLMDNVAGSILLVMAITGIAGLLRSGATETSIVAKGGLGLTLLILSLLGLGIIDAGPNIIELHGLVRMMVLLLFDANQVVLLTALFIGWAGLLLASIIILRTGRWRGWHAYTPLLVGVFPLLSLLILHPSLLPEILDIPVSSRNQIAHGVGALFALCWLIFGIALRAESSRSD